ncbi:hypothetical protein [Legionella rowbothamii]|uniref:hypothetical protein n=1 Tax=Legionella rowbothamii TaxID=96229 RepID=UPI001056DB58|nr:hypothetical protein [Legionella rowbothamii]
MSLELFHWVLALYVAGLFMSILGSIQSLLKYNEVKRTMDIDVFQIRPSLKSYLILKPIFWPYFFITEKSPIDRISELFFKHYGDEGHTYLQDNGLKNFLRDVTRGKNRYENYQVKRLFWPIDEGSEDYQEHQKYFPNNSKPLHAEIIYAQHQEKYLVGVMWSTRECLDNAKPVSRFQLDECESMTFLQFQRRLLEINQARATEFFSRLDNKN